MQQKSHSSAPGTHLVGRRCLAAGGAQVSTLLLDVLHWQMILLIMVTLKSGEAPTILVALQLDLLGRTVSLPIETKA